MKFSVKDLFSKYEQIPRKLVIRYYLLRKSLAEYFIFRPMKRGSACAFHFQFVDEIYGPCVKSGVLYYLALFISTNKAMFNRNKKNFRITREASLY